MSGGPPWMLGIPCTPPWTLWIPGTPSGMLGILVTLLSNFVLYRSIKLFLNVGNEVLQNWKE
ncbi:MAG: hypothetical protein WCE25_10370 [Nitrososphaeraceae archaeon]